MYIKRETVDIITAVGGAGTGYSAPVNGQILSIQYVKTDFADGVDFTITLETTGRGLWTESDVNASAIRAPRQPAHDQAGAALTFDETHAMPAPICAADERVKIVIAAGGDAKSGTFHITVG